VNLYELSREYCDLESSLSDEDIGLDEIDTERFEELKKLNEALGDLLSYPRHAQGMMVVKDSEIDQYAMSYAREMFDFDSDHPLFHYVDWDKYGEELLQDHDEVEWEGSTYHVEGTWNW
jgi:hypothetical protein